MKTKRFCKTDWFPIRAVEEGQWRVKTMKRAKVTPAAEKDGRPGWLARLPDPWDEKVLAAAFDVFAAKGFDGATMAEIASAAEVSKRTLYERYADKADLFRAILAWGARGNLPAGLPAGKFDAEEALVRHAEAVLGAIMRPESIGLMRIVASAAPRFPEIGKMFDETTRAASLKIVRALAWKLAKEKKIATPDYDDFASDFIGLIRGDIYFRALVGATKPLPQSKVAAEARRIVTVLLKAYRTKG
jgi:TetR/AcrR family transcriptional repressor of mexJK operon